jgi:hypothetical protein
MKTHVCYAVKAARDEETEARPENEAAVPVLRDLDGARLARGLRPGDPLAAELGGLKLRFPLPKLAPAILERIDGRMSLGEIRRSLPGPPDEAAFMAQFGELYAVLNGLNRLLLRFPARNR